MGTDKNIKLHIVTDIKSVILRCKMLQVFRNPIYKQIILRHCSTDVENKFIYRIKPERIEQIAKSPSGWVPPADPPPELPFHVTRTRTNNIPVYCKIKGGGNKFVTEVRKVRGDLRELERCIRLTIGDQLHYQINELTSTVKVKGKFEAEIKRMLKELGF